MLFGKVIRELWLKHGIPQLKGVKLLEVAPFFSHWNDGEPVTTLQGGGTIIADTLTAGVGENVLVSTGSKVRDVVIGSDKALKKVVIGIIDEHTIDYSHYPEPLITNFT